MPQPMLAEENGSGSEVVQAGKCGFDVEVKAPLECCPEAAARSAPVLRSEVECCKVRFLVCFAMYRGTGPGVYRTLLLPPRVSSSPWLLPPVSLAARTALIY